MRESRNEVQASLDELCRAKEGNTMKHMILWYTMKGCSNLVDGAWPNVPGAGPRKGVHGADSMDDTNQPPRGPFYRLERFRNL